jgi:hypothetical protein
MDTNHIPNHDQISQIEKTIHYIPISIYHAI